MSVRGAEERPTKAEREAKLLREATLEDAETAALEGNHDRARAIFASIGISYVPGRDVVPPRYEEPRTLEPHERWDGSVRVFRTPGANTIGSIPIYNTTYASRLETTNKETVMAEDKDAIRRTEALARAETALAMARVALTHATAAIENAVPKDHPIANALSEARLHIAKADVLTTQLHKRFSR